MDFEELQQSWKKQSLDIPELSPQRLDELMGRWNKQQRKLKRNNILVTVSFFLVFIDFGWVYYSFHNTRTVFFGGSLLAMACFMLVYLGVIWKGVSYDNYDPAAASNIYISKYLDKLNWQRKTITLYSWIHAVLLWGAFMFYCYDITRNMMLRDRVLIDIGITVYIFGMHLLFRFTKKKRQLKVIDELIDEMTRIKKLIDETE